jgi:MoaA/NifB/PqqE/SkfB family radical SAM enzyme
MLSFSIDGVGEHFNYIRHPAKFDEVKGHILKLKNLNYDNIYIDICYTVSIYNIFYLDEILEFGKEIGVDVYFNYVYTPYHVSSRNLPQDIKDKIKNKFDGFANRHPNHTGVNQVATTINYMEDGTFDKKNFKQFITETKFSDDYRGESFSKTFPEYYELFLKSEEFDDEL